MGNCHYCFNCGRCRGEMPEEFVFSLCMACGHDNEEGALACARCGASLTLGNTAGSPLPQGTAPKTREGGNQHD